MRRFLAASLIAVSVLAVSAVANGQKGPAAPSAPTERCVTVEQVRQRMAGAGLTERAYLTGERAERLLRAGNAPAGSATVLILTSANDPAHVALIVFDGRGCQSAMGGAPADMIAPFLSSDPQT